VRLAGAEDREAIHRVRHEVYAGELRQHAVNAEGAISDRLDGFNVFIASYSGPELLGFISVTPPGDHGYSIDKYLDRESLPFPCDDGLYEVRLLTVKRSHRGRQVAGLLMYAALRWVEARGGRRIVALGRREVLNLYLRAGLRPLGRRVTSGAVTFELLSEEVASLSERFPLFARFLERLERTVDWKLSVGFRPHQPCYHGGAFFEAIGPSLDHLERRHQVINADVLDAWFTPCPGALAALRAHLPWLLQTSPPADCGGLVETIARVRGIPPESIVPAAGSSDLIFRAFREWLDPSSRVLLLDPSYGEYGHITEQVIGCRVSRLALPEAAGYRLDPRRLEASLQAGYRMVVLVNPNSPTGHHLPREELAAVLERAPPRTLVWIDETYVDYAGADQSLERLAAGSKNLVVSKSMSKVYALSGVRAAYLCAPPALAAAIRRITPPWVVGLPAQVAAVKALLDPGYYAGKYAETRAFRSELAEEIRALGDLQVLEGAINSLLCRLPSGGPDAAEVCRRSRAEGLFLRDASRMSQRLGRHALRIAVKDRSTNRRMVEILRRAISTGSKP
jgi:histidinol-phosphate/aromatic aminotransferase/cobyric acid decarboxylase-like protein/GNAT superfamily N-acetyltransferase